MIEVYEETSLTPLRVAQMSGFTDWSSQPSLFKHYPHYLFRYKFDENLLLKVVENARKITSKSTIGAKPYYQLNTPSAGNLHPLELYVQMRGIKGILSGIYHVDAGSEEIVLIQEVNQDGVEAYLGMDTKFSGMIFILSCVAFRSEWKYAQRAIRYCYLDAGHQIAALKASLQLHQQKMTILSDFNKEQLNNFMGFKNEEFVTAVLASGEPTDKRVKEFKQNLMYVSPTDYSELSDFFVKQLSRNYILKSDVLEITAKIEEKDIYQRRSARYFGAKKLTDIETEYFMRMMQHEDSTISCYNILVSDSTKKAGVYLKNKLLKEGFFAEILSKMLVNQSFVKDAQIISVITSQHFSANKLMQAGALVHNLYLEAEVHALGCSGIGAFYDAKLQKFLNTSDAILYVSVLGSQKS